MREVRGSRDDVGGQRGLTRASESVKIERTGGDDDLDVRRDNKEGEGRRRGGKRVRHTATEVSIKGEGESTSRSHDRSSKTSTTKGVGEEQRNYSTTTPRSKRERKDERISSPSSAVKDECGGDESNRQWGGGERKRTGRETEGHTHNKEGEEEEPEKPSFEPSGLLAAETNVKNGVLIKYTLPLESERPDKRWRLYLYKKDCKEESGVLLIYKKEYYMIGKDRRVADVHLLHETVSKQHAVLQYRRVKDSVRPYLIDLQSTNGSYLNSEKIEPCRYYELREFDNIRFGKSTREYVLLHDRSGGEVSIEYKDFINQHAPLQSGGEEGEEEEEE